MRPYRQKWIPRMSYFFPSLHDDVAVEVRRNKLQRKWMNPESSTASTSQTQDANMYLKIFRTRCAESMSLSPFLNLRSPERGFRADLGYAKQTYTRRSNNLVSNLLFELHAERKVSPQNLLLISKAHKICQFQRHQFRRHSADGRS